MRWVKREMVSTQAMGSMTSISWPRARAASTMREVECSFGFRDNSAIRTARCYHARRACTIGKMWQYALVACVVVGGCAPPARDVVVAAAACHGGPVALWLDFEGAGVVHATSDDAAAMPVKSSLAASSAVIPPFDALVGAPKVDRADAIDAVVDRVRALMLPYDVAVVTARPPSTPYTCILVG